MLALLLFAFNDLSGKWSTLQDSPTFPTLFCMFATGSLCFGGWWLKDHARASDGKGSAQAASPRWSEGRTFLIGMGVGITNAVGMVLILHAFELGKAGLVSAVVALNVLIVLLYTRFVVKDRFSGLELSGMSMAFVGIIMMRIFS
ncbi:EamA family transporter [Paenibacillus hexagrammi]|uniref:EamA family transporter n=2 Tax=Paenibacillus hexagrammi TaxID=2908839 RepID=A0ABY3SBF6_9BACL|nr:EamA family transporter [Paenibacillus sp. YPD9-1]